MKVGGGDDRGQDGWMALPLNGHEFKQTPGDGEVQRRLACCSPWHPRVGYDLVTE